MENSFFQQNFESKLKTAGRHFKGPIKFLETGF